jgi:hypothetical protein
MANKTDGLMEKKADNYIDSVFSDEIQHLIARKVQTLRREQDELMGVATQLAYKKLHEEIRINLVGPKFPRVFSSIPLTIFQEIAFTATAITINWPNIVWESIKAVLDKAQLSSNSIVLNTLADEFVWGQEQKPFTDEYVNPDRFRDVVYRALRGYGVRTGDFLQESLNKQLSHTAALIKCGISNVAIQAREEIGIAIDEYVIEQNVCRKNLLETVITHNDESSDAEADADSPVMKVSNPVEVFRSMEKLTFDELSIAFVGDESGSGVQTNDLLEISARGTTRLIALAAMDLIDLHRRSLNKQGVILLEMVRKKKLTSTDLNKKNISRLRKTLRSRLGISSDPFETYRNGVGWQPRFSLFDKRGAADRRAKREAEGRTISYDEYIESGEKVGGADQTHQSFDFEKDEGGDWLAANDPDAPT